MSVAIDTVVFDLDGTLYDHDPVYDRYAEEIAARLPDGPRERFLRHWGAFKNGTGPRIVGLGYDESRRSLFRHSRGQVTGYLTWDLAERAVPVPREPVSFGAGWVNVGDLWGVLSVLAGEYGLSRDERQDAFLATRVYMRGEGRLAADAALGTHLSALRRGGVRLVVISNSPIDSVEQTLAHLDIRGCFDEIVGDAAKPAGMTEFFERGSPQRVLSVGDNYVNDIEPALDAGARAVYIDRHDTGLGSDRSTCEVVRDLHELWPAIQRVLDL